MESRTNGYIIVTEIHRRRDATNIRRLEQPTKEVTVTKYKLSNGMRQCSSCQSVYPDTDEYFYKYPYATVAKCKICQRRISLSYANVNSTERKKYFHSWYNTHRNSIIEKTLIWQANNPEKTKKIARKVTANRNAKKKGLPNTLTQEEIEFSIIFFDNKCAYCKSNLENGFHLDHFIPLKNENCPGTIAQNILPVCPKCNQRKNAQEPVSWLNREFGTVIAMKIIDKLKAYSEALKVENRTL